MRPTTRFILVSVLFHLLYTTSIFDIYFTSPVVHPSRRFSPLSAGDSISQDDVAPTRPPADRLVLIVGDGLRADTLYKHHVAQHVPAWAAEHAQQGRRVPSEAALHPSKDWGKSGSADAKTGSLAPFDAAPFLRSAALERGAWGLSHTRVPTESRPGHVALIAGMYEDVSAVTKGWKLNPVSFDSVFNQSSHTFSFGSPDILPMFAIGATPGKVDAQSYAEEAEDFTADATKLDVWVLDRLRALFDGAATNATLHAQLHAPQTVFFLHLLGLDTTGHTYRPQSPEYVGNLVVVDAIAAETERLLDDFYGKEANAKTAFVFTADHGMSDKGNHGDGEPDNTRTPLVAWGAGIRGPRKLEVAEQTWRKEERERDSYYRDWGALDNTWREDVEQADITALMSSLIGVNFPANSEGRLPVDYLATSSDYSSRSLLANALEILEVYRVKHEQRKSRQLRYIPYKGLSSRDNDMPGQEWVDRIRAKLQSKDHPAVERECKALILEALQGAQYLQTYDWLLLVSIIVTGYIGSLVYSVIFILRHYVVSQEILTALQQRRHSRIAAGRVVVSGGMGLLFAKFASEQSPWTYYLYAAFAGYFWARIFDEGTILLLAWKSAVQHYTDVLQSSRPRLLLTGSIVMRVIGAVLALELMVAGYLNRLFWSAGFVFIGFLWPGAGLMADVKSRHEPLLIAWFTLCGICSVFTLGDVEKQESIPFLVLSGVLFLLAGGLILGVPSILFYSEKADTAHTKRARTVLKLQLALLVISTVVTASSSYQLQQKNGLPRLNQIVGWLVLLVCLTIPFLYGFERQSASSSTVTPQSPSQRLLIIVFAFAPIFVLMSIRDETLFFGCYTLTLLAWAKLEASLYEEREYQRNTRQIAQAKADGKAVQANADGSRAKTRALEKEDVRLALFFLFFLHVGFFGTGNVASISSFYLSPVYRLVPIFSPFLMAALLLLKILVPFVILASVLQMLCLTPANAERTNGQKIRKMGIELDGPPLFGELAVGGLGLRDAYGVVLLACLFTDVLALNFLLAVKTQGSWLEIGRTITHFAMANLLQVFMLTLGAVADSIVGRGLRGANKDVKSA